MRRKVSTRQQREKVAKNIDAGAQNAQNDFLQKEQAMTERVRMLTVKQMQMQEELKSLRKRNIQEMQA
eukprot:Pgem_evm1s11472